MGRTRSTSEGTLNPAYRKEAAIDTPQLTPEQYSKLEQICAAIAARYRAQFKIFGADMSDLIQVALTGAHTTKGGAWKAHEIYKPPGSYSAWIGRAAQSSLIDYLRQLNGKASIYQTPSKGREVLYDVPIPIFANTIPENPLSLPKHLKKWWALLEYKESRGMSVWGIWAALRNDAALCRMLGFSQPPSHSSICDARKVITYGAWPRNPNRNRTMGARLNQMSYLKKKNSN